MIYNSTRGGGTPVSAAQAIVKGISADGGLYVPETIPRFTTAEVAGLVPLTYQQRAIAILRPFLTDYSEAELSQCVGAAYNQLKFDTPAVAPVVRVDENRHVLELWHGPTSAFKDMALQLLPQLLSLALTKTQESAEIVILVATSGDTGKAALEGFKDVPRIKIVVFFPDNGVSEMQKLQMVTQEGNNVAVIRVRGNFDDAQTGVKQIFADKSINAVLQRQGFKLSSANSINWGRLVPQIVYYFSAYADLIRARHIKVGQPVNFAVPTGNFGNILAGYYASRMGLPINKLICASNRNNVLTDFIRTGVYDRRREFYKTISPSMDILVSSNLERLLYHVSGQDTAAVAAWMGQLNERGYYQVDQMGLKQIQQLFWADWVDDGQAMETIRSVYREYRYVLDPHTAVAWRATENYRRQTGDLTPVVVLSTASPFKFNRSVLTALHNEEPPRKDEFALLQDLAAMIKWPVPTQLAALAAKPIRHQLVCDKADMSALLLDLLAKK